MAASSSSASSAASAALAASARPLAYVSPHRVQLRGLPFHTTKRDIFEFFHGSAAKLRPSAIVFPHQFYRGGWTESFNKNAKHLDLHNYTNSGIAYVSFDEPAACHVAVDALDKTWFRRERKIDVLEIAEHLKREFLDVSLKDPYEITMQTEVDKAKAMEVGRKQKDQYQARRIWLKYDQSGRKYGRQINIAPFQHPC